MEVSLRWTKTTYDNFLTDLTRYHTLNNIQYRQLDDKELEEINELRRNLGAQLLGRVTSHFLVKGILRPVNANED